ncbi:MAG: sigma 54-interacting transcriptional regulator [Chromatiales bacterium]|nr:sigma 54-interacting transcriptional regulator [Chromatiales bacterium]
MPTKVDLQSIAETHERPFMIVDRYWRIVAANRAFLAIHDLTLEQVLQRPCHEVTHRLSVPCREVGTECPRTRVYETLQPHACLRLHHRFSPEGRDQRLRIKGFPMVLEGGEVYYGELFDIIDGKSDRPPSKGMVGSSPVFTRCLEEMLLAGKTDAPVLIEGATGTGKELAADFIHRNSRRRNGPFLTLDCTVLSESLAENDLFGHVRGAFTGSIGERRGVFQLADGGTLFLDEIGELPLPLQAKLLRVLESGEFRPLGSERSVRTDVRVLCATNRRLLDEVQAGRFREDLFHRLACLTVNLPALRERRQDIPELTACLLKQMDMSDGRGFSISRDAVSVLMSYEFPGNVRELRNILQIARTHAAGNALDGALIEDIIRVRRRAIESTGSSAIYQRNDGEEASSVVSQKDTLDSLERDHLRRLLARHQRNKTVMAQAMGVSLRTVYRKLKRHGLG